VVNKARRYFPEFAEALAEQGAHVRQTNEGYFILLPNGKPTLLHRSPSSHRWVDNLQRDIERAGLQFPEIGKKFR
jgi:hypothetical protein